MKFYHLLGFVNHYSASQALPVILLPPRITAHSGQNVFVPLRRARCDKSGHFAAMGSILES
jgi:hypothetical protein